MDQEQKNKLRNLLGVINVPPVEYKKVHRTFDRNYRLVSNMDNNHKISYYSPYHSMLSNYGFKNYLTFNYNNRLIDLCKKINRIDKIGYVFKSKIRNRHTKQTYWKNIFIKEIPFLTMDDQIVRFHDIQYLKKPLIEAKQNFGYEDIMKSLYDINSSVHLEVFINYALSRLVENGVCPSFPIFYGSYQGIMAKFTKELTDCEGELEYIMDEGKETIFTKYTLYKYGKSTSIKNNKDDQNDQDNEDNEDNQDNQNKYIEKKEAKINEAKINEAKINEENEEEIEEIEEDDEVYGTVNNCPVIFMASEKMRCDVYKLIKFHYLEDDEIISMWWQVVYGIWIYQEVFGITHNDLHLSNIMWNKTNEKYLYYEVQDKCYRVPTFGRIYKIIDFGRATFTYNNIIGKNDIFGFGRDAETVLIGHRLNSQGKKAVYPHFAVDVMTLAMNIIDDIIMRHKSYPQLKKYFMSFIVDDNGNKVCYNSPDGEIHFDDHRKITRATPKEEWKPLNILKSFNNYEIKKGEPTVRTKSSRLWRPLTPPPFVFENLRFSFFVII